MEGKEIKQFNPADLMQGVRDRIRATFVSMIPDDQWDQLIQKEIDLFIRGSNSRYSNGAASEFTRLVRQELNAVLKQKVNNQIQTFVGNTYDDEIIPELKKLIVDNAGEIMANMLHGAFRSTLDQMKYNT